MAALVGVACGGLAAQQPDPPAKKAERPRAKADKAGAFTLTIEGDVPPELAPVAGRLTTTFYQSYPKLVERFENPKKPAARNVRMVFARGVKVPAYCTGATITVSTDWLLKNPDDIGLLTHELTHVVQAYPGTGPGWMTEGLADYARLLYGPKEQPGWSLPARLTAKQKYSDSYRTTARFLQWLDAKHPGTVDKLHRRLQDREFVIEDFQTLTGSTVDALWEGCVKELAGKK